MRLLVEMIVLTAVVGASGCGLMISEGPPPGHHNMNYFSCTESDVGPAFDFVWAGLNIAGAIVAAGDDTIEDREATIAVGAFWGLFSSAGGPKGSEMAGGT